MAIAVTINSIIPYDPAAGIDATQSALVVMGDLTLSGTYGGASPAHGDAIDFTSARITSNARPRWVTIEQFPDAGSPAVTYRFLYAPGTDQSDGELMVISSTTGLEITQGAAYPGSLTAASANIRFRAEFAKFI